LIRKVDNNENDFLTKPLKPNPLTLVKQSLHFICWVDLLESKH